MRYIFILLIAFCSCTSNQKDQQSAIATGFNGFPFGAPADSIIRSLGYQPETKTDSKLVCRNVTYLGISPVEITYNLAGGHLIGGRAYFGNTEPGTFDTLSTQLTAAYGKPTRTDSNSNVLFWEQSNKDNVMLLKDGMAVTVMINKYIPNR